MPDVVNQPMININAPDGAQSIVNPLYNYTFHPQPSPTDFPPDEKVRPRPISAKLLHRRRVLSAPNLGHLIEMYSDPLTARRIY